MPISDFKKSYHRYDHINKTQLQKIVRIATSTGLHVTVDNQCYMSVQDLPEFLHRVSENSRTLLTYCKVMRNRAIVSTFNLPYIGLIPVDNNMLSDLNVNTGISGICRMDAHDKQIVDSHLGYFMESNNTNRIGLYIRSTESDDSRVLGIQAMIYNRENPTSMCFGSMMNPETMRRLLRMMCLVIY